MTRDELVKMLQRKEFDNTVFDVSVGDTLPDNVEFRPISDPTPMKWDSEITIKAVIDG